MIFASGLNSSLTRAAQSQTHSATVPVPIQESQDGPQSPSAAQTAAVTTVLRAQPGTAHYVALYGNQVKVAGIAGNVFAKEHPPVACVARIEPELGEDRVDVLAHRAVRDHQGRADLRVGSALGHQGQHGAFPLGLAVQRVATRAVLRYLGAGPAGSGT